MPSTEEVWQAYQDTFSSPSGQMVLRDLENAHYFHRSTVHEAPQLMAVNEGERNVVLRIHTILRTQPGQITSEKSNA